MLLCGDITAARASHSLTHSCKKHRTVNPQRHQSHLPWLPCSVAVQRAFHAFASNSVILHPSLGFVESLSFNPSSKRPFTGPSSAHTGLDKSKHVQLTKIPPDNLEGTVATQHSAKTPLNSKHCQCESAPSKRSVPSSEIAHARLHRDDNTVAFVHKIEGHTHTPAGSTWSETNGFSQCEAGHTQVGGLRLLRTAAVHSPVVFAPAETS